LRTCQGRRRPPEDRDALFLPRLPYVHLRWVCSAALQPREPRRSLFKGSRLADGCSNMNGDEANLFFPFKAVAAPHPPQVARKPLQRVRPPAYIHVGPAGEPRLSGGEAQRVSSPGAFSKARETVPRSIFWTSPTPPPTTGCISTNVAKLLEVLHEAVQKPAFGRSARAQSRS